MVSGSLSLLADFREESSFLPPITFGYLYSRGAEIPVCSFGIDIQFLFTGLSSSVHLLLAIISLGTATGAYTIAKSSPSHFKIRKSASAKFGYLLDVVVGVDLLFEAIAIFILLLRICQGDLIANTLLLIQVALVGTTFWSILLDRYTDVEGIRGLSK